MCEANVVPLDYLKECFDYDPDTGLLLWKSRPLDHFDTHRGFNIFNKKNAGTKAGNLDTNGYIRVRLFIEGSRRQLAAHRVCYQLGYNEALDPTILVDHKNCVRTDNYKDNLRKATDTQNSHNKRKHYSNSKVPYLGVSHNRNGKRFISEIQAHGKKYFLGTFDTPEEAHQVYLEAKVRLHPTQTLV